MDEIILEFWRCSLRSDFSEFDWDEAFEEYKPKLHDKLAEHGLLGEDEFRERMECIYGSLDDENAILPEWAVVKTDFIWIDESMVNGWIITGLVEMMKNVFAGMFSDLSDLYEKLDNLPDSEPELIQLFDECIHAQHQTGDILDDVDIEYLREEAEGEWRDEQEEIEANKPVTPIRELRALPDSATYRG